MPRTNLMLSTRPVQDMVPSVRRLQKPFTVLKFSYVFKRQRTKGWRIIHKTLHCFQRGTGKQPTVFRSCFLPGLKCDGGQRAEELAYIIRVCPIDTWKC